MSRNSNPACISQQILTKWYGYINKQKNCSSNYLKQCFYSLIKLKLSTCMLAVFSFAKYKIPSIPDYSNPFFFDFTECRFNWQSKLLERLHAQYKPSNIKKISKRFEPLNHFPICSLSSKWKLRNKLQLIYNLWIIIACTTSHACILIPQENLDHT